jgi:hypothetical protein
VIRGYGPPSARLRGRFNQQNQTVGLSQLCGPTVIDRASLVVNEVLRPSWPRRTSEAPMAQQRAHHSAAITGMRSTTGQALAIRYDLSSNTIAFVEDDWFADAVRRTSVPPRTVVRQRLGNNVTRLKPRRR